MKKLLTREEAEKKDIRNKTILGIILVVLMVLSTAGYAFYQTGETKGNVNRVRYNNSDFILGQDGYWHFTVGGVEYATAFNPKDTENITSNVKFNYKDKPLYFTYDSNRQATDEIARNIGRFASRIQYVCLGECKEDYAVKNCTENIISIEDVNATLIRQQGNCIHILVNYDDSVKAADSLIFKLAGIN